MGRSEVGSPLQTQISTDMFLFLLPLRSGYETHDWSVYKKRQEQWFLDNDLGTGG